jgi:hypothetical protein
MALLLHTPQRFLSYQIRTKQQISIRNALKSPAVDDNAKAEVILEVRVFDWIFMPW